MSFKTTFVALMLVAATAVTLAPGAAACTPSPQCVVTGAVGIVQDCAAAVADCAFWAASLPGAIVNAYLAYVHGVYCQEVGVGC